MHKSYQQLVVQRAQATVRKALALSEIKHRGLKGELRETVIAELLEPLIPPGYVIGKGEIVSAYGETSNQTDVIIADRRVIPPILIEKAGLFPLEACLLTIEVKSVLTLNELRQADASARRLARFHHAPQVGIGGHDNHREIEHVVPYVLAFGTSLKGSGQSEVERYMSISGDAEPAIRAICVVGHGFWFRINGSWINGTLECAQGEVVGFISAIVNTCQRIAATRLQPDFRSYVSQHFNISDS